MAAPRGNRYYAREQRGRTAMERFLTNCRFEPETGCVVWIGGKTAGRGHHVSYGSFWFEGRRWFAHRWSAKYIHGLDIDAFQVDHHCPNRALPNTLCVEHVQCLSARENRLLQYERRKRFIHLQVGLLRYEDVYGPEHGMGLEDQIPFHHPPAWFNQGTSYVDCPF